MSSVEGSFAGLRLKMCADYGFFAAECLEEMFDENDLNEAALRRRANLEQVLSAHYSVDLRYTFYYGAFVHPVLLLDLAMSVSFDTFVKSVVVMTELCNAEPERQIRWSALFNNKEDVTYQVINGNPAMWCISYGDDDLIVNEDGWFETDELGSALESHFEQFSTSEDGLLNGLLSFRNEHYCHPLLFLHLVASIRPQLFVKCVRVVLCSDNETLNPVFRRAIEAAGDCVEVDNDLGVSPSSTSASPSSTLATPSSTSATRSLTFRTLRAASSEEELLRALGLAPSTPKRDVAKNSELVDEDDQNSATSEEVEGRPGVVSVEPPLQPNHPPAGPDTDRISANVESVSENDISAPREDGLDGLIHGLELLELHRPNVAYNVTNHRCLLVYTSWKGGIYAFRCQLRGLKTAILRKLDDIDAFVGWFLTDNPCSTFNRCKETVSQRARESGRRVDSSPNRIWELAGNGDGGEFDLAEAVCSALRADVWVVEANVEILANRFYRRANGYGAAPGPDQVELLNDVHAWVRRLPVVMGDYYSINRIVN